MQAASPIVPLVCAYRYQGPDQRDWSPETETGGLANRGPRWNRLDLAAQVALIGSGGHSGFDAMSFGVHPPMDPSAFAGIHDFVKLRLEGQPDGRVGPAWVARLLSDAARATHEKIDQVGPIDGHPGDEWRLLKTDLLCVCDLGDYYAARILGVTHLSYAVQTGSTADYNEAIQYLSQSRDRWKKLAETADPVFAPLDNPLRHQRQYEWSLSLPALAKLDATAPALWAAAQPNAHPKPLQFTPAEEGEDPGIAVDNVRHTLQSGSVRVTGHVTARTGVKAVWLWHRDLPSESLWQQEPMSQESGSQFSATIPLTPAGLLYFIEVEDNEAQARNFPEVLTARPYWVIDPWEVKERAGAHEPGL